VSEAASDDIERLFRYILSSERGSLSYGTGVVRVRGRLSSPEEASWPNRDDLTLMHEMVHQLNALTTPFLFRYCEDYRHLASEFARWLQADPRPDEVIGELRQTLTEMEQDLDGEWGADPEDGRGFSARQLIEGAASVEPLRPIATEEGAAAFLERLRSWVNRSPTYIRAIEALCHVLGPDDGVRLFSTLVFVALHHERPGEAFATMLRQLNERPNRSRQMTSADVINAFLPSGYSSLILRFANGEAVSRAPLFNIAGRTFARSGPIDVVHLAAANPASLLFGSNFGSALDSSAGGAVTPFLTITEDGKARVGGPLNELPEAELRDAVLGMIIGDELTGVMLRLGQPDRQIRNACVHTTCPEYKGHLCSLAYPPPYNGHWSDCVFRQRFREYAGVNLSDFAGRYGLV
jgi:hypothetical protein